MAAGSADDSGGPAGRRQLFILAAGVAAIWGVLLLLLVVTTANPVTLNRAQIQQADDVVSATIENLAAGTIDVSKSWKQRVPLGRVTIGPLRGRWSRSGTAVLIPLAHDAENRWHIARAWLPAMAVVRKGGTISAAGRIVEGKSLVRRSSPAGDHNPPVRLIEGDRVAAGMVIVDGALRISTIREGPPLIYPATDNTRDQLREILAANR